MLASNLTLRIERRLLMLALPTLSTTLPFLVTANLSVCVCIFAVPSLLICIMGIIPTTLVWVVSPALSVARQGISINSS